MKTPLFLCLALVIGCDSKTDNSNPPQPVAARAVSAINEQVQAVANVQMESIYDKVAKDSVAQYEIAKRGGDVMQTCVQAMGVSAAYLQAKNEPKYNEWKAIEKADCKAAGMP
jgi:predicted component of type VI protein secretion system